MAHMIESLAAVAPALPLPPFDAGFGIYVHWPFCAAKCPYCDFNSHVRREPPDQARYVRAFRRELAHMAALAPGRIVSSVFLGGGTPSLMLPQTVDAILDAVASCWTMAPDVEITLEANPTSVEATRFQGYRDAGVNRISMGVQALNDADLKALGRMHTAQEAMDAVDVARRLFDRVSFDLIYARQHQTLDAWRTELNAAIDRAADHLSLYQLTIEAGTPFAALHAAGKLKTPDDELARALFELTQDVCAARGLPAYEISNHARPGAECRHNLVYWRYGEYAGVGPGAHGRLVAPEGRVATVIEPQPEAWLDRVERDGHGLIEVEALTAEGQGDEFLLMGLRLREGIAPDRFQALTGRALDRRRCAQLADLAMIETTQAGRLRATRDGALVLDALVADLAA